MSYRALVSHFASVEDLPIRIDDIIAWVRDNTDHKHITLFPVGRKKKAFRGVFRRRSISTTLAPYNQDPDKVEVHTHILYGEDLPPDWKRLVICKELLHVFDPPGAWVNTVEKMRRLIPEVITPELRGSAPFEPAIDDHLGAYKALAVLLPAKPRTKIKEALHQESRTIQEIAAYVKIPAPYVDIWLGCADELEPRLCELYG